MIRIKSPGKVRLSTSNKFHLPPLVCTNLRLLSFIIGDFDIDFLSSNTSPPNAPVLNIGLVSVDTKMTVACEIPLNLFAIMLPFTFINSNLTVDQVEGPVQGAVDFLQHSFAILTGSYLLQISMFYFR